jgi:hypothetical protein
VVHHVVVEVLRDVEADFRRGLTLGILPGIWR